MKGSKAQIKVNLELLKDIKAQIRGNKGWNKVNLALLKEIKA